MITSECINCGACEPECPNTAIYQGGVEWQAPDGSTHPALSNDIFFIVPEKCTECVGFYDHEACAAVCPVDCCVPNPDIPEAESLLHEALTLQLGRAPRNDTSIAYSYTNLAVVQSDLGKNASAETLMIAAVAAAKRAYGEVHPLVASIMSPLATVQGRAGAVERADSTYRATLAMRRQLLGEEHPDYAWTMFNYADHLLGE